MGLTPKQRKFVAEYLKDANGAKAAIRAGYSRKTARAQASDLLTKPDIRAALDEGLDKLELTSEFILNGIKRIATKGNEENNRLKAFELLGKHRKLFTDRVEHSGNVTLEQLVMAAVTK